MPYYVDLNSVYLHQFTKAEWLEVIGDEQPGGGASLSLETGEATIAVEIDWDRQLQFARFALGWSYADKPNTGGSAASLRLRRENPWPHPLFPWLTAATVSFTSISPRGTAGVGTKVEGLYSAGLDVAQYRRVIATVRFADRPWFFLADSYATTPAREAQRNTYFDPVPSVEVISAEGLNNIKFANGPARGTAIPAPFGTLMSKVTKTLNWMWVPHEYISGEDVLEFTPTKINSVVGRVNSDTFLGNPPGTLLLQAPIFNRFRYPIQSADIIDGYFGWNIKFPMQFFDPERGGDTGELTTRTDNDTGVITIPNVGTTAHGITTANTVDLVWVGGTRQNMTVTGVAGTAVSVDGGTGTNLPAASTTIYVIDNAYRGHQLVPRRENLLWYGAQRVQGQKLYPEAAFSTLFQHVAS